MRHTAGLLAAVALAMHAVAACGQGPLDGMAGAGSACVTGIDAAAANPARLTVEGGPSLLIGEVWASLSNNTYTLADYRRYNGATLSAADEEEILAKVSGDYVDAFSLGRGRGPSFRSGDFAITTAVHTRADGRVPKELMRLAFEGNAPGSSFTLAGADGAAFACGEASLSYARSLVVQGEPLSIGVSLRGVRGAGYAEILEARGVLVTAEDGVTGEGTIRSRTALGGWGYGIDVGAWRSVAPEWTVSLVVRDLAGAIHWSGDVEEHVTAFVVRDVTLEDLEDDTDDLVNEDTASRAAPAFRRRMGPTLIAGGAWARGRTTIALDVRKGYEEGPSYLRRPVVATGLEVRAFPWLLARAGATIGGSDYGAVALGIGIHPGRLRLDVSIVTPGGVVPWSGRGIGGGIAIAIE